MLLAQERKPVISMMALGTFYNRVSFHFIDNPCSSFSFQISEAVRQGLLMIGSFLCLLYEVYASPGLWDISIPCLYIQVSQ